MGAGIASISVAKKFTKAACNAFLTDRNFPMGQNAPLKLVHPLSFRSK